MPGVLSLGNIDLFRLSGRKSSMKLLRLKPEDDTPDKSALSFQYWPETLTDSAQVNYVKKSIPGGSLPLYQWVNGGEHSVSFQAMFTTDVDLTKWNDKQPASDVNESYAAEIKDKGLRSRNIDIRGALIWLRSFRMPTYKPDGTYLPPPKAILTIPGYRMGMWSGDTGTGTEPDDMVCVMTQCEIEIRASFPNGVPRIAVVTLAFEEVAQRSGIVKFPGYNDRIKNTIDSANSTVTPEGVGVYGLRLK